ncbi:MAG: carbohydrate kinase family protein [Anaerolineales bacterium]
MSRFFISGLINIETSVAIDAFPLDYFPVRYPFYGLQTRVSGVGFNIAKALCVLGNNVDFASLIGRDDHGFLVLKTLEEAGIPQDLVLDALDETPQSVILYDPEGRRQIHVDLKDIQDRVFPIFRVQKVIQACDLAVICNINFARPLLRLAREAGKWIATDVHALFNFEDAFNREYMENAHILFLSDEALPDTPEVCAEHLMGRYGSEIVVIGLGSKGALLAVREDNEMKRFKPIHTRPVVNTIGAGDALFSAFIDCYWRTKDPYMAMRAAMVFASYKIGAKSAAEGFLTSEELNMWGSRITNAGSD